MRGNGKIIQELEAIFRGAGWNVIKVIWAREWDELLARDVDGAAGPADERDARRRVPEVLGRRWRLHPRALLRPRPAPRASSSSTSPTTTSPSCAAAATTTARSTPPTRRRPSTRAPRPSSSPRRSRAGRSGPGVEARNITHQAKKLTEDELKIFRDRLELPIPDDQLKDAPYYHPGPKSPGDRVPASSAARRSAGLLPRARRPLEAAAGAAATEVDAEFAGGSPTPVSTTMAFTRLLRNLLRDPELGAADRADHPRRGAHLRHGPALQGGRASTPRWASATSRSTPSWCSRTARRPTARSSRRASPRPARWRRSRRPARRYATHGEPMIPFYIFYSMFGFQRTGDQIWAFGDARGRGFLMGATAGRTTLTGEGLQHDDGHSHILASTIPNVRGLRPGLRLRAGDHRARRHRAHVRRSPRTSSTTSPSTTRTTRMPAAPEGVTDEEHPARPLPLPRGAGPRARRAPGPAARLGLDPAAGARGPRPAGRAVRRRRRGLERAVVPAAAQRRARGRALEPPPPGREDAAGPVRRRRSSADGRRPDHRRDRLHEGAARHGRALDAGPVRRRSAPMASAAATPARRCARFFEIDAPSIAAATLSELARCGAMSGSKAAKAIGELGIDPDEDGPARPLAPGRRPARSRAWPRPTRSARSRSASTSQSTRCSRWRVARGWWMSPPVACSTSAQSRQADIVMNPSVAVSAT